MRTARKEASVVVKEMVLDVVEDPRIGGCRETDWALSNGSETDYSTMDWNVIHRAVHRHGASMIEFHLDLDARGAEFAPGHCWLPEPIEAVIRDVRTAASADGRAGKRLSAAELEERDWRADPEDGLRPQRRVRAEFAA